MSALRKPQTHVTSEEYLRQERLADFKSEYVNGEVYAMAGGTQNHAEISSNILVSLKQQLRDRPCRAFSSELKVRIDKANIFRYPDVSGLYGPILHHDKARDAYCNPAVIIEVLSPSTEAYDRGEKFRLYQLLDSLFEYILVSQERVEVEVFTRGSDRLWSSVVYNEAADSFPLRTLSCTLTLADIYEKVEFEAV